MDSRVYFSNPGFPINAGSHQFLDFLSKANLILLFFFPLHDAGMYLYCLHKKVTYFNTARTTWLISTCNSNFIDLECVRFNASEQLSEIRWSLVRGSKLITSFCRWSLKKLFGFEGSTRQLFLPLQSC